MNSSSRTSLLFTLTLAMTQIASAVEVIGSPKGFTRFHKVDDGIYRGSMPDKPENISGLKNFIDVNREKVSIKTIINLQGEKNEIQAVNAERKAAAANGIRFLHFPLPSAWTHFGPIPLPKLSGGVPKDSMVLGALRAMLSPENQPVYIHCAHGKDRTGVVVGLERVFRQGWTQNQAYQEMLDIGFTELEFELAAYWNSQGYRGSRLWNQYVK